MAGTNGKGAEAAKHQPVLPDSTLSPCSGVAIAQDVVEPLLRAWAISLGADIRQSTEMMKFEQDNQGVIALAREGKEGKEYESRHHT